MEMGIKLWKIYLKNSHQIEEHFLQDLSKICSHVIQSVF